jgi:hypothetical protein
LDVTHRLVSLLKNNVSETGKKWRSWRLNRTPHAGNTRNPASCLW